MRGSRLTIRWLHLSDVHEHSGERHIRTRMYDQIVAHLEAAVARGDGPDLIFLTGDLAYRGDAAEYAGLKAALVDPLRQAAGSGCRLFMVPGNHDLNRDRMAQPRTLIADTALAATFQSPDDKGARKRKELLFPRFEAYAAFERLNADWGVDWLDSPEGTVSWHGDVGGTTVSVVGLNTAWYSQDNDDWGRLTPGRLITEAALEAARRQNPAPGPLFVLGHHPLEAFFREDAASDGWRLRDKLRGAGALYLHGHLHRNTVEQVGARHDNGLIAFQAPAAFQAHDEANWPNGVQWGEFDPETGGLIVEPYLWNENLPVPEYQFDIRAGQGQDRLRASDGFGDRDGFWVRRPTAVPDSQTAAASGSSDKAPATPSAFDGVAPSGWEILTRDDLAARTAERPPAKEMADWFDGQFPRWEIAAAEGIRPRKMVEDLARRFEAAHHGSPQPVAVLLTGAGGEGKSAALMQLAATLLRGKRDWTCLWRSAAAAELPADLFNRLPPRPGHAWIVAIDDAENIGAGLPAALRAIQPRTDVHLILAAREADWSIQQLTAAMWAGAANFSPAPISGLDTEDANRIAQGWVHYGDEAMGLLRGQTAQAAADTLLDHARKQAARKDEGALLGALLICRTGENLKQRVVGLMQPWRTAEGVGRRSLLDVYAWVAAMHAENQLFLSHGVLADALGCPPALLSAGPLHTLRREAMIDGGSVYVLTRHRQIAEAARDWLVETGYDLTEAYATMARAAELGVRNNKSVLDIASWRIRLAAHFARGGPREQAIAVAVAETLFRAAPTVPQRLVVYASTLRRTDQAKAAFDLLRTEGSRFGRRRDVLYEWSVSAGIVGQHDIGIWLAYRSLADDPTDLLTATHAKMFLAGLGQGFGGLADETGEAQYLEAQAACGRLGLRVPELDATAESYFKNYCAVSRLPHDAPKPTVEADLARIKTAVLAATDDCDPSVDPLYFEQLLGEPDRYDFKQLKAYLLSDSDGARA